MSNLVKCSICRREVRIDEVVYLERETDHYYAGFEGFVCKDCWCSGRVHVGCSGDCCDCPLYYYCWKWCK